MPLPPKGAIHATACRPRPCTSWRPGPRQRRTATPMCPQRRAATRLLELATAILVAGLRRTRARGSWVPRPSADGGGAGPAGVDMKTAQMRLGHADDRMALAIYAQATSDTDQAAADKCPPSSGSMFQTGH